MKDKISIIYCSNLISKSLMDYLFRTASHFPMQSTYKFHKLFVEGFSMNNCEVKVVSAIPIIQESHKQKIWIQKRERQGNIIYFYPPFINITYLKHFMVFINGFFYILFRIVQSKFRTRIIVDVLSTSITAAAILAAKITKTKIIGIITDLPQMLQQTLNISRLSFLEKNSIRLNQLLIKSCNGYVLLTEQMNSSINNKTKPYCIIEGLVDISMKDSKTKSSPNDHRIIMYSGGLSEKYGVRMLIEAFMTLKETNLQLALYGTGDLVNDLPKYCGNDNRIKYFGVLPNERIIEAQQNATLLVNPRPTNEEFVKYSFPSKNMEYMVSGTPVATTKLPGMPKEYYRHVFLIDDESVKGFAETIENIMSLPKDILIKKGIECKNFVINNKNNKIQSEKVLSLLKSI